MKPLRLGVVAVVLAVIAFAAIHVAMGAAHSGSTAARKALSALEPAHASLPTQPGSLLGVYVSGVPHSVTPVLDFMSQSGTRLRVTSYYSGWNEPFQTSFAWTLYSQHITPLVQIEPTKVSLAAIADGSQDGYLVSYANQVRRFRHPVILSFAHEMNGAWYSWGYRHTSASVFIAAWRHIVNVFRAEGADNITWLWTVNSLAVRGATVVNPDAWWPGSQYVTWVGIDGYYYAAKETFSSLFAPIMRDIHAVTSDPILISETGAAPMAGQVTKIANLFAGMRADHMLGLIWFDAKGNEDWRIDTPAAFAAFRRAASS
jgi:hypothetical protein